MVSQVLTPPSSDCGVYGKAVGGPLRLEMTFRSTAEAWNVSFVVNFRYMTT